MSPGLPTFQDKLYLKISDFWTLCRPNESTPTMLMWPTGFEFPLPTFCTCLESQSPVLNGSSSFSTKQPF